MKGWIMEIIDKISSLFLYRIKFSCLVVYIPVKDGL